MKLKWMKIENFGPFSGGHDLVVDREVTVITGKNDVGKSLLLKAIQLAFVDGMTAEAGEINQERVDASGKSSTDDDAVFCEFEFEIDQHSVEKKMFGDGM
jgi:predicted ATP-dependent endonuclease of OLD family